MAATDEFLAQALARDPARPLITYYDDATGERTELSAATLANWVAKTANFLVDEVGLAPGDRVAVALPAHWQTAAVLLATWSAGGVTSLEPDGAVVAFTDLPRLEQVRSGGAEEVVALSLAPMGQGLAEPLPGVVDYVVAVRGHGDHFRSAVGESAPAIDDDGRVLSGAQLRDETRRRVDELGLHVLDRMLSALRWRDPADWVDGLLVPLAAGASLVLCAHPHKRDLTHRAEAEQVTVTQGARVEGIRGL